MNKFLDLRRHGLYCASLIFAFAPSVCAAAEFYAFGDSLTDNGRVVRLTGILPNASSTIFRAGRSSNGPVWAEYVPGLIRASFTPDNDYAINGALSGHGGYLNIIPTRPTWHALPGFLDQISEFTASHPQVGANDIFGLWIGTNDQDLPKPSLNGIEPYLGEPRPSTIAQVTSYTLTNLDTAIGQLMSVGARQFVVLNLNDDEGTRPGYLNYNEKLPANLVQFTKQGANVHLFDVAGLLNQIRSMPLAYGISADPELMCKSVPSCKTGSIDEQNTYLTADGTHVMTNVHLYIARYIANQLEGPAAISVAPEVGGDVWRASAQSALDAIDDERFGGVKGGLSDRVSVFASGDYAREMHGARDGSNAFNDDIGLLNLGFEYRYLPGMRAGAIFTSANASGALSAGAGESGLHSYRLGLFNAMQAGNAFVNAYAGAGWDDYRINRGAVLDGALSATAGGYDFGGLVQVGYLFPAGRAAIGPVADVSWTDVMTSGYTESGDPILTQSVGPQRLKGVSAGAGVRFSTPLGRIGAERLHLSAEALLRCDTFAGRTLTTAQTYASELPISTDVAGDHATYERLSLSLGWQVFKQWTGKLLTRADIGDAQRKSFSVQAALQGTF